MNFDALPSLPTTTSNVILADAHPIVRFAVRSLIEGRGFTIKAEGKDLTDVYDLAKKAGSDILIFDPKNEAGDWLELLNKLFSVRPGLNVVLLATKITDHQVLAALELGVRGILNKNTETSDLQSALKAIKAGNYWVPLLGNVRNVQNTINRLKEKIKDRAPKPTFGLTPRELEVVLLIVDGLSNKEIAKEFGITEDTAKRHLSNIYNKTGVSTRLELALFAIAHKITCVETASGILAEAA